VVIAMFLGALVALERRLSAEPEGCASCHVMRSYVTAFQGGRDLDAAHARAGLKCTDCHQGYTLRQRAASAISYAAGVTVEVPKRRYGDEMCNRCHVSLERQAERTDFLFRNPHRSHWPELQCADCHLGHARQVDFCNQCHDHGGQRMTGDPVVPRTNEQWTPAWLTLECRP
jgi:fumarate reductase flavoprotein subunit